MQKITTVAQLKEEILLLKIRHAREEQLLKRQFNLMSESLKPLNLVKSAFKDMTSSPALKNNIGDTAIGMTTGYLSKKLLTGASHNPLIKLFGIVLQVGVANFVTKHPGAIKSSGLNILKKIFNKRSNDSL